MNKNTENKPRILVVRTAAQLAASVAAVRARVPGAEVAGLAIAETRAVAVAARERVRADERVVFTSGEAVRFFGEALSTGCWCVGEATAAVAVRAGWQVLGICGAGCADGFRGALVDEIGLQKPQKWVHWRAANGLTAWHESLRTAGHTVREVVGYESVFIETLPAVVAAVEFDRSIVMSAASAACLLGLRERAKLPVTGAAYVPSTAVAVAAMAGFERVVVAAKPTLAEVLNQLPA